MALLRFLALSSLLVPDRLFLFLSVFLFVHVESLHLQKTLVPLFSAHVFPLKVSTGSPKLMFH